MRHVLLIVMKILVITILRIKGQTLTTKPRALSLKIMKSFGEIARLGLMEIDGQKLDQEKKRNITVFKMMGMIIGIGMGLQMAQRLMERLGLSI
jgi:hypothetical protein